MCLSLMSLSLMSWFRPSATSGRTLVLVLELVLELVLVLLTTGGCGETAATTPLSTSARTLTPLIVPYRPSTLDTTCIDDSGQTDVQFIPQANQLLADVVDAAVQPNSGPFTLYYTLMSGDPYDPAATPLVIQIPGLPAQPSPPTLQRFPPPSDNPFADAQAHARIAQANAATLRAYQQVLARDDAQLAQVRAATKRQSDALRHLPVHLDASGTNLFGCVALAADRVAAAPPGTDRWLFLTGDLLNDTTQDDLPPQTLHLHGLHVRALDEWCASASECRATKAFWTQYFAAAGTQDVRFFDPAQSQTLAAALSSLFTPPAP